MPKTKRTAKKTVKKGERAAGKPQKKPQGKPRKKTAKRAFAGLNAVRAAAAAGVLVTLAALAAFVLIQAEPAAAAGARDTAADWSADSVIKVPPAAVPVPEKDPPPAQADSAEPEKLADVPPPEKAPAAPEPEKPAAADVPLPEKPVPAPEPEKPAAKKSGLVERPAPKPAAKPKPKTGPAKTAAAVPAPAVVPTTAEPAPAAAPPPEQPEHRGTIAFVIDDAGNSLAELEPFLRFPGPLTIAVLPGLPHSAQAARMIRAAGKELILHQPMEAVGGQDPGPGAVYAGMPPSEIREIITANLDEIGPAAGINNHQGSLVTEDEAMMETVLALCREKGVYFLDSRTTAQTAAPAAAEALGIPIAERDVFIDNEQDRPSMSGAIEAGLKKADKTGRAVMIGHAWSHGLEALLAETAAGFAERGYTLSTVSDLIEGGQ